MKKVMKKVAAVALALAVVMGMSATAFASGGFSTSAAKTKALKNAGLTKSQVKYLEADYDDGRYEVEFTKKSNGTEYSFEFSRKGTLMEKTVEKRVAKKKGSSNLISKTAAKKAVAKNSGVKLKIVNKGTCYKDKDDGQYIYEVKFKTSTWRYEYDVQAKTGKIIEWSKERR